MNFPFLLYERKTIKVHILKVHRGTFFMNFWPLETWRKKLRKNLPGKFWYFFLPRKSIGKPLLSNVVWWEKDFFQGISVWKKKSPQRIRISNVKNDHGWCSEKILNNQVLKFFPHGKKTVFSNLKYCSPQPLPCTLFFSTIVRVEKVQAGWKNYCLLQASYSSTSGPLPRQQL